jgi:hypothetical protein
LPFIVLVLVVVLALVLVIVIEKPGEKCASPYIGERFGENSVGGKWLMGAMIRISLTLSGQRKGAVWG